MAKIWMRHVAVTIGSSGYEYGSCAYDISLLNY